MKLDLLTLDFDEIQRNMDVATDALKNATSFQAVKRAFDNRETAMHLIGSADVLEISSHIMEMMLFHHGDMLFDDMQTVRVQYLNDIYTRLLACALSTEYEHFLFTCPDATAQERKDKYIALYRKYYPCTTPNDRDILFQLYEEAFLFLGHQYTFCYVLAWIHAVEMTREYKTNPWPFYEHFRNFNTDVTFLTYPELVQKYHLHNAFDPQTVDAFVQWMQDLL